MSQQRDVTRLVRSWIREDQHESADRILGIVLDRLDTTPQRRSRWPAWRSKRMNTYVKLIAAAAAVLVVAIAGFQLLPGTGGVGGDPTNAPSPSPSLLARGTFNSHGAAVELEATGGGSDVTGQMTVSDEGGPFTVGLECARTNDDGLIEIGGSVTESTNGIAPEGTRVAIILQPGSPVQAVFWFEHPDPPQANCPAFLEGVADDAGDHVEPIEGTVELGP
jgi:hypothetical protein